MYQWIESFTPAKEPSSCCCVSGTRSPEQYTYKLGWANKPVSISSVQSEVMQNPTEMPVASQMLITDQAYLGQIRLSAAQTESIGVYSKVELTRALFDSVTNYVKSRPEFSQFNTFERQDNYLLCLKSRVLTFSETDSGADDDEK